MFHIVVLVVVVVRRPNGLSANGVKQFTHTILGAHICGWVSVIWHSPSSRFMNLCMFRRTIALEIYLIDFLFRFQFGNGNQTNKKLCLVVPSQCLPSYTIADSRLWLSQTNCNHELSVNSIVFEFVWFCYFFGSLLVSRLQLQCRQCLFYYVPFLFGWWWITAREAARRFYL